MGTVVLDYSQMVQAKWGARQAAAKCGEYTGEIQRKVTQKLDSLERGANNLAASANYFAQQKIADLNHKREQFEQYGHRMAEAMQYAKDTDNRVSSYIKTESREFRSNNGMEVHLVIEFLAWITTNVLNRTEFGRWLNQKMRDIGNWADTCKRRFKQWYHLEGGKYILKVVLNAVIAVAAVLVVIFVAWPALAAAVAAIAAGGATLGAIWTVVTAAAGFVTAFIAIFDSATKAATNLAAADAFEEEPGWAHRYGSYSSFADYLRKTNFHNSYLNKISYIYADKIDTVMFVAGLIRVADTAHRGINFYKSIKANGVHHYFRKMNFKTKTGNVTWSTFKYGLKSVRENIKTTKSVFKNTNITRLNKYYKDAADINAVYQIKSGAEDVIDFLDKGAGKYIKDRIREKVRDNILGLDTIKNLRNSYSSGKKLYQTY